MTTEKQFLQRVEAFLRSSRMSPATFGRQAINDPTFVAKLRGGRSPSLRVADKVLRYIRAEMAKALGVRL